MTIDSYPNHYGDRIHSLNLFIFLKNHFGVLHLYLAYKVLDL